MGTTGATARWLTSAMPDVTPDEPARPLSVVLFGYGLAGRVFHGPLLGATPALSLDAIVTSDPGRQAQARADHPTADVLDSADDVWDRPFDLAVVATANVTHVPLATRSIEAGMSVVVDKPVGPTAASVRDLAERARANGVLLVPFHNRGLDSDFLTVLRHADAIGTIHRFESRIERFRLVPKGGWRDRAEADQMGGMLYDLGPHVTYQALRLLGPARQVAAAVRIVRPESVTDDDVVVTIWHESGAVSELTVSQASVFGQPRFTVLGTRGGLQVAASDSQEAVLAGGGDPAAPGWGVEPSGTEAVLRRALDDGTVVEETAPLERGRWNDFYPQVAAAMRGDGPPPATADEAVATAAVLDAARESAVRGVTVSLRGDAAAIG